MQPPRHPRKTVLKTDARPLGPILHSHPESQPRPAWRERGGYERVQQAPTTDRPRSVRSGRSTDRRDQDPFSEAAVGFASSHRLIISHLEAFQSVRIMSSSGTSEESERIFVSLGMFIIDDFQFHDENDKPTGRTLPPQVSTLSVTVAFSDFEHVQLDWRWGDICYCGRTYMVNSFMDSEGCV